MCKSIYYHVEDSTNIASLTFKEFLSNQSTKKELTIYLATKYLARFSNHPAEFCVVAENVGRNKYGLIPNMVFNHDEADTLLIWHGIDFSKKTDSNASIRIISPDTDVLILGIYFADSLCKVTKTKTFSNEFDIQQIAEGLGKDRSKALLSLHAISGCDTVGRFACKGKLTWFKGFLKLQNDLVIEAMQKFGDDPILNNSIEERIAEFVSFVYTGQTMSLPSARWYLFSKKMAEGEKLPPTPSAFKQHLLRALLQVVEWKDSNAGQMNRPDPTKFGWIRNDTKWQPVSSDNPPISNDLMQLVKCNCKGKCNSKRCSCRRSDPSMVCSEMCGCVENCENSDPTEIFGLEEKDEEEFDYN